MKRTVLTTLALTLMLAGCTEQRRARSFGGTTEVKLSPGDKVVGATWKDSSLWVLTRPARAGEQPETLHLHESSSMGVMQAAPTPTKP